MKDNRTIEERVAYRSYLGLCIDTKDDGPEVQEGWEAARDGDGPEKNPYRLTCYCKKAKQKKYDDGTMSEYPDKHPIRGGRERMEKMLKWRDGYNAWVELFGGTKAGWAM